MIRLRLPPGPTAQGVAVVVAPGCVLLPCQQWLGTGVRGRLADLKEKTLANGEARNDFVKRILWGSTDFLRLVVGEVQEKGTITFTFVCAHCKDVHCGGFHVLSNGQPWCKEGKSQHEWLVVWSMWNAIRLAEVKQIAHPETPMHEQFLFPA